MCNDSRAANVNRLAAPRAGKLPRTTSPWAVWPPLGMPDDDGSEEDELPPLPAPAPPTPPTPPTHSKRGKRKQLPSVPVLPRAHAQSPPARGEAPYVEGTAQEWYRTSEAADDDAGAAADSGEDAGGLEAIKVYVRLKGGNDPSGARCVEASPGDPNTIRAARHAGGGSGGSGRSAGYQFACSGVMDDFATQEDVYGTVVRPLVDGCLGGKSVAVMCYGQTGSGKTYTMMGHEDVVAMGAEAGAAGDGDGDGDGDQGYWSGPRGRHEHHHREGIAPRLCHDLFEKIDELRRTHGNTVEVYASFLEIYCENITDLLNPKTYRPGSASSASSPASGLDVMGGVGCDLVVPNGRSVLVESAAEATLLVRQGMAVRQTASTASNDVSSRGHAVFVLRVYNTDASQAGAGACAESQIYLCDLAGSERQKRTRATGKRLAEASKINTSLLSLRRVIDGLSKNREHIPYRDSKLTRILQNALGGTGRASIICTVNPDDAEYEEAVSTLRFGCSAAQVTNNVVSRVRERPVHEWEAMLVEKDIELRRLKQLLASNGIRAGPGPGPGPGPTAAGFRCPLTQRPFTAPVVARDGFTYEHHAIVRHFTTVGCVSPVTGHSLSSTELLGNRILLPAQGQDAQGTTHVCVDAAVVAQPRSRATLLDLPDDLLLEVLARLPGRDLAQCERVCSLFHHLISGTLGQQVLWAPLLARAAVGAAGAGAEKGTEKDAFKLCWQQNGGQDTKSAGGAGQDQARALPQAPLHKAGRARLMLAYT